MDRFIDDSGREVPISGVVEFARLLDDGRITAETPIFDGTKKRWFPAKELPGFPAPQGTPPSSQSGKPKAENGPHLSNDPSPVEDEISESNQWRILHDGEEIGPVPESEVVRMLSEDRFPADTKVQTADMVWPLPANTLAPFRDVTAAEGGDEELEYSKAEATHTARVAEISASEDAPTEAKQITTTGEGSHDWLERVSEIVPGVVAFGYGLTWFSEPWLERIVYSMALGLGLTVAGLLAYLLAAHFVAWAAGSSTRYEDIMPNKGPKVTGAVLVFVVTWCLGTYWVDQARADIAACIERQESQGLVRAEAALQCADETSD